MPRKSRSEEEFVVQALQKIGIPDDTIWNFRDAGIVTAEALGTVEEAHFGGLGVKDAEHREKLLLLVQIFKKNVPMQTRQSRRLQQKREKEQQLEATAASLSKSESFLLDEALQSSVEQSLEEEHRYCDDEASSKASENPFVSHEKPDVMQQPVDHALSYDNGTTDEFLCYDDADLAEGNMCGQAQKPAKAYEVESKEFSDDDSDDLLLEDALRTPTITVRSHRKSTSWNVSDSSDSSSEGVVREAISMKSNPSDDDEMSVVSSKSLPTRRQNASKIPARQYTRIPQKQHRRQTLVPKCRVDTKVPNVPALQETRTGKQLSSVPANKTMLMSPLQEVNLENPRLVMRKSSVIRSTSSGSLNSKKTNWKDIIKDLRAKNDSYYSGHAFALPEQSRIRVVVRKRPIVSRSNDDIDIIHPFSCCGHLIVYQPKSRVDLSKYVEEFKFAFDQVFHQDHTNRDVYEQAIRNTVQDFLNEQWVTIVCYGQTGAGKTHTMMGIPGDPNNMGLYAMAAWDIFHVLPDDLDVHVSMFEIYNGKFWDILEDGKKRIQCLEDDKGQMHFRGLSRYSVGTKDDFLNVIQGGIDRRATGVTSRNTDSSRSHAILQVHLLRRHNGREVSRMTLVDLAGSERASDTNNSIARAEGAEINTSLLALKEVIRAMANNGTHFPFRLSPLTQVLKSAFMSSTTVFIACVAPDLKNCDPTMNTLRYADRIHQRNPSIQRQPSADSMSSHPSQILDDILASPKSIEHPLITTHREMVAAQLELLEAELKMVDQTGDFDTYLVHLEHIHDEYSAIIEALREQLRAHRTDDDSFEDLRD